MPIYSYKCKECGKVTQKLRKAKDRKEPLRCECGGETDYTLPLPEEPTIMETRDRHRNKQVRKDVEEKVRKRAKEHFIEHELTEQIDKHGVEHAKRVGWIGKDGKKITKSDLK